jgi:hypothetical protein
LHLHAMYDTVHRALSMRRYTHLQWQMAAETETFTSELQQQCYFDRWIAAQKLILRSQCVYLVLSINTSALFTLFIRRQRPTNCPTPDGNLFATTNFTRLVALLGIDYAVSSAEFLKQNQQSQRLTCSTFVVAT